MICKKQLNSFELFFHLQCFYIFYKNEIISNILYGIIEVNLNGSDSVKKSLVVTIVILVVVLGIEGYIVVKNNFFKEDIKNSSFENNINSDILKEYHKTVNYKEYVDNSFTVDEEHIELIDTVSNQNEFVSSFRITLNNKVNNLDIRYYIENDSVYRSYTYNGEVKDIEVIEDLQVSEVFFENETLEETLEKFYLIIEPYHFSFLTGEDNQEYFIIERSIFSYYDSGYYFYIYNDNFDKLTFMINGEERDLIYSTYSFDIYNLHQYDYDVGYRQKDYNNLEESSYFVYSMIQDNQIYFIDVFDTDIDGHVSHIDTINEYCLKIDNNEILVDKINEYEVLYIGASA